MHGDLSDDLDAGGEENNKVVTAKSRSVDKPKYAVGAGAKASPTKIPDTATAMEDMLDVVKEGHYATEEEGLHDVRDYSTCNHGK
ncbi:hypothetical protein MRX96_058121 [Rhipicephalus microplus]